jgi:exopolysaccharide production protein ExoQ
MGPLKTPQRESTSRAPSATRKGLVAAALLAMWLALGAANWGTLNWKLLGGIMEERIEPMFSFVRVYGGVRTTISGIDIRDIIYTLVVAGALAAVIARPSRLPGRRFWLACIPLAGIVGLSRASLDWSVARSISLEDLAPFFVFTLVSLLCGAILYEGEILGALEALAVAAVVLNLVAVWLYPNLSMSVNRGELGWRALFIHKNNLGPMMVFANTVMCVRLSGFRLQHWAVRIGRLLVFVLSLFLLWRTRAVTSYVALMAVYFVYLLALLYLKSGHRLRWGHWVALAATVFLGGALLWGERGPVLAVFNRSSSLTGRLPLWRVLGAFVAKRPLVGYGFGRAFWAKEEALVAATLNNGWRPPHAHNGFLDFTLALGIVGVLFLLIFFVEAIIGAVSHLNRNRTISSAWPLLLVTVLIVPNLTESLLATREFFYWLLLVLSFGFTLQEALRHRAHSVADGEEPGNPAVATP